MGKWQILLTDSDKDNICQQYSLLKMIRTTAEETGFPHDIVRKTLRERGIKITSDPNVIPDMPKYKLWAVGKTKEFLTRIKAAKTYEELAILTDEVRESGELELFDDYEVFEEQQCLVCRVWKPLTLENFSYSERMMWFYKCNRCLVEVKLYSKFRKLHNHKDPCRRLHTRVSRGVRDALKRVGKRKDGISIMEKLPYTIRDLKSHLEGQFEPWMNWDNWGKYRPKTESENDSSTWTWQIDHIHPGSKFWYDSMDHPEFLACWALENLRPFRSKDNILKSDKLEW